MNSIDPFSLKQQLDRREDITLIDVREPREHEQFNIGGILIPMNTVLSNLQKIPSDKKVVIYCQKGIRSGLVIQRLQLKGLYPNLFNLEGGMDAWSRLIGT